MLVASLVFNALCFSPGMAQVDSTSAPSMSFKGAQGWDLNLGGRYSLATTELAHIGGWAQYVVSERGRQVQGISGIAAAQRVAPVLTVSSERFSDPLPLQALWRDDLARAVPRGDHNLIYLRDEVRLGARWSSGVLSAVARQSATLVANGGAVSVIQDVSSPGPPAQSYDRPVKLRMSGFVGAGLAFDTSGLLPGGQWSWQSGVQVLSLRRFIARDLRGRAAFDEASGIYALQAQSGQADDRLKFPFQQSFDSSGWGLLFNGGLSWQASEQARLSLSIEDLGRLQWSGLPQDDMNVSTNTSQVDQDGYLVYRPLVSGRYSQTRYTTKSVATWRAGAEWQWAPAWLAVVQVRRMDGFEPWLPYTGAQWASGNWRVSAGWLWHERALSLAAANGPWQLTLAADRLDASAHARTVSLGWVGAWDAH